MENISAKKNLLVLTSGGDAPGMNAAIRAVVRSAHFHELNVYATFRGYQGLVDRQLHAFGPESVANIIQRGGTILKSERCVAFHQQDVRDQCRAFLQNNRIDYMIVIGGDGSFRGSSLLEAEGGPKTIGIPATIDNDICGSEYTIGYDTARNTALSAIDNIRDTAGSHERHFLVEVMGRNTGFLAADVGIAGGAEMVLTPEYPLAIEEIIKKLASIRRQKLSSIIVVAEAGVPGRSVDLAEQLYAMTKEEYRVCILGHTQRGGTPSAYDRLLASQMGAMAVSALIEGNSNKMVALVNNQLQVVPTPTANSAHRRLQDDNLLQLCNQLAR